jgi:hypothetical protein
MEPLDDVSSFLELGEKYGDDRPFKRVLSLLQAQGCTGYELTQDFAHEGYGGEWEQYYQYKSVPLRPSKYTTKLDFFANSKYLGYAVLRPLPAQRVCEAVIAPPGHSMSYLTCEARYESVVSGQQHQVEGASFVQQDGQFGLCAEAALSTLSRIMCAKYNSPSSPYTVDHIKQFVSLLPGAFPMQHTEGLSLAQCAHVLKDMTGEAPLVYSYEKDLDDLVARPSSVIYRYVESGLPVLLMLETERDFHAAVVVGHTFSPYEWWPEVEEAYYERHSRHDIEYYSSISWVDGFIVQDDNIGPYSRMSRDHIDRLVRAVVVPLRTKLALKLEVAEGVAYSALAQDLVTGIAERDTEDTLWKRLFLRHKVLNRLILRAFLVDGKVFQRSLGQCGICEHALSVYRERCFDVLPDRICVVEISIPEIFPAQHLRLGEVLLDPMADPRSEQAAICFHIPGAIFLFEDRLKNPFRISYFLVEHDRPYKHFSQCSGSPPKALPCQ